MAIDKITTPAVTDDSVTLAKMAPGTDGNIISYDASGNPVAVATGNDGQVLTSTGAGSPPAFETLPVGGITSAHQWRLTTSFSGSADITSNLEQADSDGYGGIGSVMSQSSGVFTFPSTGVWLISAVFFMRCNGANRAATGAINTTTNNSSYDTASNTYTSMYNSGNDTYANSSCEFIFDVTNTTTHKVRFGVSTDNSSSVTAGDTNNNNTAFVFIRLGDT